MREVQLRRLSSLVSCMPLVYLVNRDAQARMVEGGRAVVEIASQRGFDYVGKGEKEDRVQHVWICVPLALESLMATG